MTITKLLLALIVFNWSCNAELPCPPCLYETNCTDRISSRQTTNSNIRHMRTAFPGLGQPYDVTYIPTGCDRSMDQSHATWEKQGELMVSGLQICEFRQFQNITCGQNDVPKYRCGERGWPDSSEATAEPQLGMAAFCFWIAFMIVLHDPNLVALSALFVSYGWIIALGR